MGGIYGELDMTMNLPRKKSIPLVSELVLKTMAAKRNATGLQMASDLQRKTLNDDELVSEN